MRAYLSQNTDKKIMAALEREDFKIIRLAPFSTLSYPVDTHADMLLLAVGDTIFIHKDYEIALDELKNTIKVDEPISSKYPNDVLLNIAVVGKNVFCNTKYASKTVIKHLEDNNHAIHHVEQGYAHCSTCIVSENAIISADFGIVQKAQKMGIDALLITSGHISLPPYNYGFIGGSCGSCGDKIYFCGALKYHPDGDKIRAFCEKHQKIVIELLDAPLVDIGGILIK